MALRIAGLPTAPEQRLIPPDVAPEPPMDDTGSDTAPDDTTSESPTGGGTLDPAVAGYKDPEAGPFQCSNCKHFSFSGPNTCEYVSGYIDDNAICNLFTTLDNTQSTQDSTEPGPEPGQEPPVGQTEGLQ